MLASKDMAKTFRYGAYLGWIQVTLQRRQDCSAIGRRCIHSFRCKPPIQRALYDALNESDVNPPLSQHQTQLRNCWYIFYMRLFQVRANTCCLFRNAHNFVFNEVVVPDGPGMPVRASQPLLWSQPRWREFYSGNMLLYLRS